MMSTQNNPEQADDQAIGLPKERILELARHYAEIQRYQKENDLEDKGDPPEDDQ